MEFDNSTYTIFVLIGLKSEYVGRDTINYLNTFSSFGTEIETGEDGKKQWK